jgi:hypothetical protein
MVLSPHFIDKIDGPGCGSQRVGGECQAGLGTLVAVPFEMPLRVRSGHPQKSFRAC